MKQPLKKEIIQKNQEEVLDKKEIYTLLIDSNNLLKVSYHGDNRFNNNSVHIGGIYQFLLQLKIMLGKKDFDHVYAMWDGDMSGRLRYDLYPDYKKNRNKAFTEYDKKMLEYQRKVIGYTKSQKEIKEETDSINIERQKKILQSYLEELFIRQLEIPLIESDDVIAYYCKNKRPNEKVVIISSDKDLTMLINESVIIWSPSLKQFVTKDNHKTIHGIVKDNVLIRKIFCGDASDNIKGIKGLGEATLMKLFPKIVDEPITFDYIISEAEKINEERKNTKQKPLKVCENIINKVTDGCQGDEIYEINKQIIDLNNPLIPSDVMEYIDTEIDVPIDPDGRSFENLYRMIIRDDIIPLKENNSFVNFFSIFKRLINKEMNFFKNNL